MNSMQIEIAERQEELKTVKINRSSVFKRAHALIKRGKFENLSEALTFCWADSRAYKQKQIETISNRIDYLKRELRGSVKMVGDFTKKVDDFGRTYKIVN